MTRVSILLKSSKHAKSRDSHATKGQQSANAALAAPGSPMTALVQQEPDSIDKVQFVEKLHDARKLVTKIMHSQTK